jgi:Zn-dependent metalloprotease
MLYGDGGDIFRALSASLDVVGHEFTHGVTQFTAGLEYKGQSGALNESISDVFGSLIKQRQLGQTADAASWLIGEGILGPAVTGTALRSMKAPGTAYDGDRQPATMAAYVQLPDDDDPANDHGGVHINSGIPNHAFYVLATTIGGHAWEKAGHIWFTGLTRHLHPQSDFAAAADATTRAAADLFGSGSFEQKAVRACWSEVGVT